MAITRLMHMKESPGVKHQHLKNAIDYVLDIKHGGAKTDFGKWVGGNAGVINTEVLHNFLVTKELYEKLDGRQGYHFVVSFDKGETTPDVAYKVIEEFCAEFLGDSYDYVFALHTDKVHLHGHIIFNSVARTDGYKYHYVKGDWEKYIQPITDKVCERNGLSSLVFDDKRVGVSYASWLVKKDGPINWGHIIQADVDYAISQASTMEEFFTIMNQMNYSMRTGVSHKKNVNYITFKFHGADGKTHSRRSYNLAEKGYSPEDIAVRIKSKEGSRSFEVLGDKLSEKSRAVLNSTVRMEGTKTSKRLYQAVSYYKLPNPFAVPAYQVRKDMLRIDKLLEEVKYIKVHRFTSVTELEDREAALSDALKQLYLQRNHLISLSDYDNFSPEQMEKIERYKQIQQQISCAVEINKDYEELEDELQSIAEDFPLDFFKLEEKLSLCNAEINKIKKEQKVIRRVLNNERKEKVFTQDMHIQV